MPSILKETIKEGYIKYIIVEGDGEIDSYIEFLEIKVPEKFRKQGIGTALIERLVEIALREGITTISVRTSTDGKDVFGRFLEANNFHPLIVESGIGFRIFEKNFDGHYLNADGTKEYRVYKNK